MVETILAAFLITIDWNFQGAMLETVISSHPKGTSSIKKNTASLNRLVDFYSGTIK